VPITAGVLVLHLSVPDGSRCSMPCASMADVSLVGLVLTAALGWWSMKRQRIARFARSRVTAPVRRWLPNAHDPRYPRPGWLGALRAGIEFWWVALVLYLTNGLTSGVLQVLRRGLASVLRPAAIFHLLLLDRVGAALGAIAGSSCR
jgi:hypothetical protein